MIRVRTKESQEEYILLGTGFGMFRAHGLEHWTSAIPRTKEGDEKVVAICGPDGEIKWAKAEDVLVISVDGVSIREVF